MTYKLWPFSTSTNQAHKPYCAIEARFHFSISRIVARLKKNDCEWRSLIFNMLYLPEWLLLLGTLEAKFCPTEDQTYLGIQWVQGLFPNRRSSNPFIAVIRFICQLISVHCLINSGPSFLHIVNKIRKVRKIIKFLTLAGKR